MISDKVVDEAIKQLFAHLPEAERKKEVENAKKILANEATAMCHGADAAAVAERTAAETFEQGQAASGLPTVEIPASELADGIAAFALFARAGLANSNGEARRLIRGGGGRVNDEQLKDENAPVTQDQADAEGVIKLSAGKKRHVLVKLG